MIFVASAIFVYYTIWAILLVCTHLFMLSASDRAYAK
jgi:hypothetical protein